MEGKGWNVERIWSRNWWRNSNKEINRIHEKIQVLRETASPSVGLMTTDRAPVSSAITESSEQEEKVLEQLVRKGESDTLEFKSSILWDYKLNQPNKSLVNPVLKTIAAFMNSQGGVVIVGVDDNGAILGLEKDFEVLGKKKSWDEWVRHFIHLFNNNIGKEFISYVQLKCIQYNGKPVAIVEVKRNIAEPTYLDPQGKSEFYIREGTITQLLNSRETVAYIKQHWHR